MSKHWERKGLAYYSVLRYSLISGSSVVLNKKLSFLSYHLIKFFHGENRLRKMATPPFYWSKDEKEANKKET